MLGVLFTFVLALKTCSYACLMAAVPTTVRGLNASALSSCGNGRGDDVLSLKLNNFDLQHLSNFLLS